MGAGQSRDRKVRSSLRQLPSTKNARAIGQPTYSHVCRFVSPRQHSTAGSIETRGGPGDTHLSRLPRDQAPRRVPFSVSEPADTTMDLPPLPARLHEPVVLAE